ncbi:MAG TPA: carbamoyltransferase C-terminal domain-containing protein [Candidatus Dormibacteraeota bacterium]|nr:carbamoyltransferase C-terminal domain-containing protein [Candidatus Dormibacteraeota bacterium]
MYILGLSKLSRDSAVALFDGHSILAAIEEAKLTRLQEPSYVPRLAIARVFESFQLKASDLSAIALAELAPTNSRKNSYATTAFQQLRHLLVGNRRIFRFDHHLSHAASAYYTSGFDRSLILTLDEGFASRSGLVAMGEADRIKLLRSISFPNSLGWFYSRVTHYLGLQPNRDEHKLQWLSKDGQPEFLDAFRRLFAFDAKGLPVLNRRHFTAGPDRRGIFSPRFYREASLPKPGAQLDASVRSNIARSAQDLLEELVITLANNFRESTNADSLCVAGGVFLNVLLVRALELRSGFKNVYVQPVAGNAGTALGAGFLARKKLTGQSGRAPLASLALGPEPTSQEIKAVLDNCKIVYRYMPGDDQLNEEVCKHLERGKIVAWCQGRTEFGHRALGHRSLLASPFSEYVVENVNQYIKHREEFHPFALSVPAERAAEYFVCSSNCRFMASLGSLKNPVAGLERFAFHGDAVRVHTVDREANPGFWRLLHKFGETAPAPILVNTSFNLFGEPLVTDPRTAVRSFYCAGVDVLALGPFLVVK